MDILWTLLGAAIILAGLIDVFLSVLHLDRSGIITPGLHRGIWRLTIRLGRASPRARRPLIALAGPMMLVSMLAVWVVQFVVGFALVYWPQLDSFRANDELATLTFTDALYYSGITGTVLGYGDITPLTAGLKCVSVIQSTLGFVLLTGVVTYLLNVVNGVAERNAVALRLHLETARRGDGVETLIRWFESEQPQSVHDRYRSLTVELGELQQKLHHFPILALYYRSESRHLDQEPMWRTISQLAMAGLILAEDPRARTLRSAALDLEAIITDIYTIVAHRYLPNHSREVIERPDPTAQDRRAIEAVGVRLNAALGWAMDVEQQAQDPRLLALAFRTRIVLDALDQLTRWRVDHPDDHPNG